MSAGTFPQSSIPLDAEPGRDWLTCGTCGRSFPDIYPAARCPFEYDHETETDTMIDDTIPQTPEGAAVLRAFEAIGAILGGSLQWEVGTIEYVAEEMNRACRTLGLPEVSDQQEVEHRYWCAVGDRLRIQHDDLDEIYGEGADLGLSDRVEINLAGNPADGRSGIIVAFTAEGLVSVLLDGEGVHFALVPMSGLVEA